MRRAPRSCARLALLATMLGARLAAAGYTEFDVRRVKGDAAREHVVLRGILPAGDLRATIEADRILTKPISFDRILATVGEFC